MFPIGAADPIVGETTEHRVEGETGGGEHDPAVQQRADAR